MADGGKYCMSGHNAYDQHNYELTYYALRWVEAL